MIKAQRKDVLDRFAPPENIFELEYLLEGVCIAYVQGSAGPAGINTIVGALETAKMNLYAEFVSRMRVPSWTKSEAPVKPAKRHDPKPRRKRTSEEAAVERDAMRSMINTTEASRITNLSVSSLNKYRVSGDGPRFFKLGRRVVYDIDDVESWIAERRRSSTEMESN